MAAAFLIGLREGLEAALILGVLIAALRRLGQHELAKWAWWGLLGAVATSLAVGLAVGATRAALEGRAEEIFEGTAMLLAWGALTWAILWMRGRGRTIAREVRSRAGVTGGWGLFGLSFVAVAREGVETVLFLSAAAFQSGGTGALIGGITGIGAAVLLGWGIYALGLRVKLSAFFTVTSWLLLFVAAGFLARGVHELQEAAVLPTVVKRLWDLSPILSSSSALGRFLSSLFGYNPAPSFVEAFGYFVYVVGMGFALAKWPWRSAIAEGKEARGDGG